MNGDVLRKAVLGASGLLALWIGVAITVSPTTFYAAYDIDLGGDVNLLSELRAPGASLAALGALILAGSIQRSLARLSALVGTVVFLAYAAGRIVGAALDGPPSDPLVHAAALEILIGALCAATLLVRETDVAPAIAVGRG